MEKTIKLGNTELRLRSSLFTIISYRNIFGSELFSDVKKLEKINLNENIDDYTIMIDIIFKIVYVLNKPFTDKSYDHFLNEFDFDILSDMNQLEILSNAIATLLGSINKKGNDVTP